MSRPLKIKRLTLGANSTKAFELATSYNFNAGLLLSICKENIFVCKGQQLQLPSELVLPGLSTYDNSLLKGFTVLDCEPVNIGILCVTTEFVIVDKAPEIITDIASSGTDIPLEISDFLSTIPLEKFGSHLISKKSNCSHQKLISVRARVVNTESKNITSKNSDTFSTLYVSKHFAADYGLFNECLVLCGTQKHFEEKHNTITTTSSNGCIQRNHGHKKTKHRKSISVGKIEIIDDSCLHDIFVHVTPTFAFNCNKAKEASLETELYIKKYSGLPNACPASSCSASWFCNLPYASEVYIETILSPSYNASADFSNLLQRYFSITRTLKRGDVISISAIDSDFWQDLVDTIENPQPVIYFKVHKIVPKIEAVSSYRVHKNNSSLFLTGTTHAFVPTFVSSCLSNNGLYPPGLQKEVKGLVEWIKPLIGKEQGSYRYKSGTTAVLTEEVKKIDYEVTSEKVQAMETS